jgi:hypothetical protein
MLSMSVIAPRGLRTSLAVLWLFFVAASAAVGGGACGDSDSAPAGDAGVLDAQADSAPDGTEVPLSMVPPAPTTPPGPSAPDGGSVGDAPALPPGPAADAYVPPGFDAAAPPPLDAPVVEVPPPPPAPPINSVAMKILPAGATLLGGISVACTYGPASTASGVRWCAFAKPGPTLATLELWVMNVSKLPPVCDGTSADCIKLSDRLFGGIPQNGGPQFPSAHRFYGDLLIFYADAVSRPADTYAGPIYAWQPGWTAAKKISAGNNAFQCVGVTRAPVALCLENVKFDATPITFDLTAGRVDGDKPVQKIATVVPAHPTTTASQWQTTFTSDGKYFIYSAATPAVPPATEQTPETLYYLETEKIGLEPPKAVATPGVSAWDVAPDFSKWFYLRDFNYSRTQPSGTLYMADFPSGANPVKLTSTKVAGGNTVGVSDFTLVPTQGLTPTLAFVNVLQKLGSDAKGEFISIKNPAASLEDPANVVLRLPSVAKLPFNSPDLRFGRYFSQESSVITGLNDAHILKYDGSPSCVLTASPTSAIFGFPFLENAGLTFWIDNYDQTNDTGDAMVASPVDCTSKKRKFASAVDYWFVKGDDQLVYTSDAVGAVSTLQVAKIVAGDLGAPTVLQTKIERKTWALLPNQEAVLYQINSGAAAVDGIYFMKLP